MSGNIDIYIKEDDIDLLIAIDKADVSEAIGGRGGQYGVGGVGGNGGRGGKTATKVISTRNGDGSYNTQYITIPGGSPGVNGRPGNDGKFDEAQIYADKLASDSNFLFIIFIYIVQFEFIRPKR